MKEDNVNQSTQIKKIQEILEFQFPKNQIRTIQTNRTTSHHQESKNKNFRSQSVQHRKQSNKSSLSETQDQIQFVSQFQVKEISFPKKLKKCQILEQFRESQINLRENQQEQLEKIKTECQQQTEFINQIYLGKQDRKLEKSEKKLKDHLSLNDSQQKIFLDPRMNTEQNKRIQHYSRSKNSFLSFYREQFRVDGKIMIADDSRAVDKILFQQLSASAIASRKWSSSSTYRNSLYAAPLVPEFADYPLDENSIRQISKTRQYTCRSARKNHNFNDSTQSSTTDYLNKYSSTKNQGQVLFSSPLNEYTEILDYMQRMKPGPQKLNHKLEEAQREVEYIKKKGSDFRKKTNLDINLINLSNTRIARNATQSPQSIEPKKNKISNIQDYQDEVYDVRVNVIGPTNIHLLKQQKDKKRKAEAKTYIYQKFQKSRGI